MVSALLLVSLLTRVTSVTVSVNTTDLSSDFPEEENLNWFPLLKWLFKKGYYTDDDIKNEPCLAHVMETGQLNLRRADIDNLLKGIEYKGGVLSISQDDIDQAEALLVADDVEDSGGGGGGGAGAGGGGVGPPPMSLGGAGGGGVGIKPLKPLSLGPGGAAAGGGLAKRRAMNLKKLDTDKKAGMTTANKIDVVKLYLRSAILRFPESLRESLKVRLAKSGENYIIEYEEIPKFPDSYEKYLPRLDSKELPKGYLYTFVLQDNEMFAIPTAGGCGRELGFMGLYQALPKPCQNYYHPVLSKVNVDVQFAGEFGINEDGFVNFISDKSGHYMRKELEIQLEAWKKLLETGLQPLVDGDAYKTLLLFDSDVKKTRETKVHQIINMMT